MTRPMFHVALAACGAALGLLGAPAESQAIFHRCRGCQSAPTYAAPTVAYSPCTSCPQTVNYVPQTYYRPVCGTVPVTSYSPIVSSDPCTGCAVTTYRPVTSYVQQVQYVPYTTYRLAYTPPCTTCSPAAATAYYAPAAAVAPTSSCCGNGSATYSAAPTSTGAYGAYGEAPQPVINGSSSNYPATPTEAQRPVYPSPDPNASAPAESGEKPADNAGQTEGATTQPTSGLQLIHPDPRTASRPHQPVRGFQRTSYTPAPVPSATPVFDDGWRPASR